MSLLSVRVDHVAAIRYIRRLKEPDPSHAAVLAEIAGADGITCRLREDRLFIRDRDVYILKEMVKSKLTVQIAPVDDLIDRVIEVKPWMVTLVPAEAENPDENRGVDLDANRDKYAGCVTRLKEAGIHVGCLLDPDIEIVKNAARIKIDTVELNSNAYVYAADIETAEAELDKLEQMAQLAVKLGMTVYCGGWLNYHNIRPVVEMGLIDEFTVGHAIMARALRVGLDRAVREMVEIVHAAPIPE